MFFKNNLKPAYAAANASCSNRSKDMRYEAVSFNTENADEFNSFDSTPNYAAKNTQKRPQPKAQSSQAPRKNNNATKSIIIAVAAIAILIAIIAIVVAIVASGNKDIKFANNSFIVYSTEDNHYSVVANGKVLDSYENEVELIVAEDHSFAYVLEKDVDGTRVYVATSKKIEEVCFSPVTVLATASLQPGVVYQEDDGVYLYTAKNGDEGKITSNLKCSNWMISADASTVIYTSPIEGSAEFHLCTFRKNNEDKMTKNLTPVAVSGDGSLVYGYGYTSNDITNKVLYVARVEDDGRKVFIDDHFGAITAMNVEGNEIIYYTNETKGITSYIYAFNEKKIDEAAPSKITMGIYAPVITDSEVAILGSFAKCYVEGISGVELTKVNSATYYIGKDYSIRKVASTTGKFSPDGDYLYYIAESGALMQLDLSDDNYNTEKIPGAEDIVDFAITEKGNVYYLMKGNMLKYYNVSKDSTRRISDDAENIEMYDYSNTLYFTEKENVNVFSSKEGSSPETVKFDSTSVTGIPVFSSPDSKRTYVAFEDSDSSDWKLFYTSNGGKFKLVCNSCDEISDLSDFDLGDLINGGNNADNSTDNNSANNTNNNGGTNNNTSANN